MSAIDPELLAAYRRAFGHDPEPDHLHPDHLADLRRSGLSDLTIFEMGVYSLSSAEMVEVLGATWAAQTQTVLAIPYPGTDFTRYKLFPPLALPDGSTMKYFQKPRSAPALYRPSKARAALKDPGVLVRVAEGEKKAARADEVGLVCIGLGGLWNWMGNGRAIPDLDAIDWVGRSVLLTPDSDVWTRPDLLQAVFALAKELEARGATVRIEKLPAGPEGQKQGLDDFLAHESVAALEALPKLDLQHPAFGRTATWWKAWKKRKATAGQDQPTDRDRLYLVHEGRLCRHRQTKDGPMLDALCNFAAAITEEVVLDDGAETTRAFVIEGILDSGTRLPPVRVPASRFPGMTWVTEYWGIRAVVRAGLSTRDCLREAIQTCSPEAVSRHVYTHTGWREIDGRWFYLHATGAIGATGYEVDLGPELVRYRLPATPEDPVGALRASLNLLRAGIAPLHLMVPLWGSVYRAPTATALPVDVSLWVEGPTGSLKSTLAALALAHYGPFDRLTLPGAWSSTANQLERRAFLLKDTVFVVDDYAPSGVDARELEGKAARLIRAAGNRAGRGRLRSDLTERAAYPPRGLIVVTGEQRPPGQSLLARTIVIEADRSTINLDRLAAAQAQATRLPHAMVAYLSWLAPQMPALPAILAEGFTTIRRKAMAGQTHLRVPEAIAHLYLGVDLGLTCASELGACSVQEADDLRGQAWDTLEKLSAAQGARIVGEKPSHRYLRVLATLVAQGRAVLLDRESGDSSPGKADLVGWLDAQYLYFHPEAAWHAVTRFCRETGMPFPLSEDGLRRDLEQEELSVPDPGRHTATVKISGRTRRVLRVRRLEAEQIIGETFHPPLVTTDTGVQG